MNFYINLFNSREKAIIIWLLIVLVWALFRKYIRTSILGVLKSFVQKQIVITLVVMLLYVAFIILLFYKIQLWDVSLIKDTIFWILGTAFILLMNANNATQDEHYFKRILLNNLKFILVLEFIVDRHTFNLWVELILMPLLFILVAMSAVAETKKEDMPVKKIIDSILAIFVIFLIISALFDIFGNYQGFVTTDNLRSLLLPPLLTLAYVPFLYFFALFMAYENLFVRLDIFLKNVALAKFAKGKILALCHVNLGKLNKFAKENSQELMGLNDEDSVLSLVQQHDEIVT